MWRTLSAGADFVDLGAGLGAYALAAAEMPGDRVIHACESDSEAFRWLSENVRASGPRIRAYPHVFPEALENGGRPIGLVRVGGSAPVGHVLAATKRLLQAHSGCRVVVEYCRTLHGDTAVIDGLLAEGSALGLRALRIDRDGALEDLRPDEIRGAFSLNLVWERSP
jgi:precorrin-6B methylase 2